MSKSLTLNKLSEYDDLLTDHLIDKIYFWTTTHKADRHKTHSSRIVKTSQVVAILQKHIISPKGKLNDAVAAFLKLKTAANFHRGLTEPERADFIRHVRKYLGIYYPQAGFEICSTNRYPGLKSECCVISNKSWNIGEVAKYLNGTIVAMTEEEEDHYEGGHDFSILHSSRLDSMCLFLGPARFVNHDCQPNGAFITQGGSIAITMTRPVAVGEEITVFYSPDYFGPNNADCLCATCEKAGKGGYSAPSEQDEFKSKAAEQDGSSELEPQKLSPVSKRKVVQTIEVSSNESSSSNESRGALGTSCTLPDNELNLGNIAKLDVTPEDSQDRSSSDKISKSNEGGTYLIDGYVQENGAEGNTLNGIDQAGSENYSLNDAEYQRREYLQQLLEYDAACPSDSDSVFSFKGSRTKNRSIVKASERKSLRPRRPVHDYNLIRRSLASVNPVIAEPEREKLPKQNGDSDYCSICDVQIPHTGFIEEIWSLRESVGVREIICKKCERHAKLYGDPWPIRTPKGQVTVFSNLKDLDLSRARIDTIANTETPLFAFGDDFEQSARVTNLSAVSHVPSAVEESINTGRRHTMASIEIAKAQMKQGNISIPRLVTNLEHIKKESVPRILGQIVLPGQRGSAVRNPITPLKSQSKWFSQKSKLTEEKYGKVKQKHGRAKSFTMGYGVQTKLPRKSSTKNQKTSVPDSEEEVRAAREVSLSPDSRAAAFQVNSVERTFVSVEENKPSEQVASQNASEQMASQNASEQMASHNANLINSPMIKCNDLSFDEEELPSFSIAEAPVKEAVSVVSEEVVKRSKKAKRSGSWYYVPVESGESDSEKPVLLIGRTRREEQFAVAADAETKKRKVYEEPDSEDGSDVSLISYTVPAKFTNPRKRNPRPPTWEYISIESEAEEKPSLIMPEGRAARRRSAPVQRR